jgi:hypothetical protein
MSGSVLEPDATYYAKPKPSLNGRNPALSLHELLGDYFGSKTAAAAGGALDAAIWAGTFCEPTAPIAIPLNAAAKVLNTVPKFSLDREGLHYDEDYWKKKGKEDRELYNEQMNKLKADLYSTFIMPLKIQ